MAEKSVKKERKEKVKNQQKDFNLEKFKKDFCNQVILKPEFYDVN